MCDLTYQAFDLADKYRITVMVLADAYIGQMMEPVQLPLKALHGERKDWALYGDKKSRKNLITSILMDPVLQSDHNWKLQNKYQKIADENCLWEELFCEDASILFIAYGITARICLSAVKVLREKGIKAGLMRPITLFPFPEKRLAELSGKTRMVISAELSNGQMSDDIDRIVAAKVPVKRYLWLGGVIPSVQEIVERTLKDLEGGSL